MQGFSVLLWTAVALGEPRFVGNAVCKECHAKEYLDWLQTPHARAFSLLEAEGEADNGTCQPCHTTGYGWPGGFMGLEITPDRVHVGCESCHGPGELHAQDPEGARLPPVTEATCRACHTPEQELSFDFERKLPLVDHRGGEGR